MREKLIPDMASITGPIKRTVYRVQEGMRGFTGHYEDTSYELMSGHQHRADQLRHQRAFGNPTEKESTPKTERRETGLDL